MRRVFCALIKKRERSHIIIFPTCPISCVREISKIYEECIRSTLGEALARYEETDPRGEFVLVVEGYVPTESEAPDEERILELWRQKAAEGMGKSAAAKAIAKEFSLPKQEVYDLIKDL